MCIGAWQGRITNHLTGDMRHFIHVMTYLVAIDTYALRFFRVRTETTDVDEAATVSLVFFRIQHVVTFSTEPYTTALLY